jgi:adenosylcobinamide-phosphate synthase
MVAMASFQPQLLEPDRIPKALAAFVLTAVFGFLTAPPAGNANPLIWLLIDKVFGGPGDKLDRPNRARTDLFFRGFLVSAAVVFITILAAKYIKESIVTTPYYGIPEILALSLLLTSGAVWRSILKLYFALEGKNSTPGAYFAISRSTRSNLSIADDFTITRAAMGFLARGFDKGLISPIFWYLIGGLPAAMIYASLACLSWRFGKSGFSRGFGAFPQAVERILGFIPGLITGLFIALAAAFTPTAGLTRGFMAFLGFKGRAPYEQGGYPLSVMAWALNISLGGAVQDLQGSAIKGIWVGPDKATAQNDHQHLRRALYINVTAHILFAVTLCGTYWWLAAM